MSCTPSALTGLRPFTSYEEGNRRSETYGCLLSAVSPGGAPAPLGKGVWLAKPLLMPTSGESPLAGLRTHATGPPSSAWMTAFMTACFFGGSAPASVLGLTPGWGVSAE